jgi:hypothetical protein
MRPLHSVAAASLALGVMVSAVSAQNRAAPQDPLLTSAIANCDQQAAQQTAALSQPTSIDPTHILAWPLLLNDLAARRQQEANKPQMLAAIEQQRQQCRQLAEAAAMQRVQEIRNQEHDRAGGYQPISVETFMLDGKELSGRSAKVSMRGFYLPAGNIDLLFADQKPVIMATTYPDIGSNVVRVPLLTDDASHGLRRYLLQCKENPGAAQIGCPITIVGNVTMCEASGPVGAHRELPCVAVVNGRP